MEKQARTEIDVSEATTANFAANTVFIADAEILWQTKMSVKCKKTLMACICLVGVTPSRTRWIGNGLPNHCRHTECRSRDCSIKISTLITKSTSA